jgi:hypothetical protein
VKFQDLSLYLTNILIITRQRRLQVGRFDEEGLEVEPEGDFSRGGGEAEAGGGEGG